MAKVVYTDLSKNAMKVLERALKAGLLDIAEDLAQEIKQKVSRKSGGGKEYIITRKEYGLYRKHHIASEEGSPPVVLTGALRDSIGFRFEKSIGMNSLVQIGVLENTGSSEGTELIAATEHVPYPENHHEMIPFWLEIGTEKIKPRPFIGPVMNDALAKGSTFRSKLRSRLLAVSPPGKWKS